MDWKEKVQKAIEDGRVSPQALENIENWMNVERYAAYRDELKAMIEKEDWRELNDSFYQIIPFGTGGRRGKVGIGSNRMNEITVAESAQGVANKLQKEISGRAPRVVIAYDTRLTSAALTEKAACVLAGNGVEVRLFDGPRATPHLSFAIRDLEADAGIVISASHNPPSDNGFKAYWSDGGQIVPPLDGELIEEVRNVSEIKEISFSEAYGKGLILRLNPEDDARFYDAVLKQSLTGHRNVRIVYSPIHGTGMHSVYPVLLRAGFADLHLVENQKDPDGRFPNVPNHAPNPEVTTGLDASIELARAIGADIVLASDPDADRLACAVRDGLTGDFVILTGNQTMALMMEYIGEEMHRAGTLRPGHRVYSTVVSSPLMPTIARAYGLTVKDDLLVGFKWIAEQIETLEDPENFLFGSEESIGFMKGPQTRDKDAAVAALIFCELAAREKALGRTVLDLLEEIYRKYGYFCDKGTSVFLHGAAGSERMARIMDSLRKQPPRTIGGREVVAVIDRAVGEKRRPDGTPVSSVDGARSNLLIFQLREDNKSWIAVRPSGTEPKIKFYFSLFAEVDGPLEEIKSGLQAELDGLLKEVTDLAMAIE